MTRILTIALGLTALIAATPVTAQTIAFGGVRADTSAPVDIAADSLSVDQSTGVASFSGHVKIGQGDMRLSADLVRVEYGPGGQREIKRLHASGSVTLVSGPDAAEAAEAVYDVASGKVTLTGNVLLTQGDNVMSGDKVFVDLKTGSAQADGRVRTILNPSGN